MVCTNFLNTPGVRDIQATFPARHRCLSSKPKEDKLSREGANFSHHPFSWKTPTSSGGLWTQKVNLGALFSCLSSAWEQMAPAIRKEKGWPRERDGHLARLTVEHAFDCKFPLPLYLSRQAASADLFRNRRFGEGLQSARGATAILAGPTTLKHVWKVPSHELLQTDYCIETPRPSAKGPNLPKPFLWFLNCLCIMIFESVAANLWTNCTFESSIPAPSSLLRLLPPK